MVINVKKKVIIVISILLTAILSIIGYLIYKNHQEKIKKLEEQKLETRYEEVYKYSFNTIKDNNRQNNLELKTNDEKLIYEYFNNVLGEKESLKQITYDNFLIQNDITKLYENIDEYIKKLDEYNLIFDIKKKEIEDKINKTVFIDYLKENNCSEKGIKILNKKIKADYLKFESEEINNLQNSNTEKTNTLKQYITYLNENKNNWYLENGKLIAKTNEVLNKLNENNKTFNINITTEKEIVYKQIPVIMYHGVSDTTWGLEGLFMKVADFESQMKYLSDNGYETIFIEDIKKDYTGKKVVVLTFDDGYVDFYTNVLPIIKKYNIKTNLYVITNTTNDEKYINEDQIKELSNSGLVSIGSHTVSHSALASLNSEQIEMELKNSKKYLENLLGKEIQTISYPTGSYNSAVLNIAQKYYKYGITTINGVQSMGNFSKYKIIRKAMYRGSGMSTFKNIVNSAN